LSESDLLRGIVLILFVGISVQWFSWKIKFPSIILLLITGVVLGPIAGVIPSDIAEEGVIKAVLKLSLAIILFEGGIQLKFHELRESGSLIKRITTVGTIFNFIFCVLFTRYLLDLSWEISLTFGSILIVTGPTVILPMLRQSRIPRKLSSGLKWEGIVVDPFGALLTVLFFELAVYKEKQDGLMNFFIHFSGGIFIALLLAFVAGYFVKQAFKHSQVPEHLKVPFIFALVLTIYLIADLFVHESGLFATTAFGISLGNSKLHILDELHKFKETITVILVSLIFIILSGTLEFSDLALITSFNTLLYVVAIMVVARPLALNLSLIGSNLNFKERAFISWIAPRGIVAAAVVEVFAPRLVEQGFPEAETLVPLIFTIIFATVVIHGFSMNFLSKKLKLNQLEKPGILIVGSNNWSQDLAMAIQESNIPVIIADSNWNQLSNIKMKGIPTYYGEVLSDTSEESLDLTDVTTMMAATDNDSYNALACKHFSSKIGHDNVYQLPMHNFKELQERGVKPYLRGNVILSYDDVYEELEKYHYLGWIFHKTKITENFDYHKFREGLHPDAKVVLLIRNEKNIFFNVAGQKLIIKKDDIVLTYGPSEPQGAITS
jgi:NhaP-type Na+/H+ or K+/H+ antiporter